HDALPIHLPGKNPADCMGDSIMHMDQIQSVSCDDFGNLTRQCDVIWRIFEYAVISDVGLMDMDIGVAGVQPERNIRCDEVHLVPFFCQFDAKFRCNDSAAAHTWIAGYSYFHTITLYLYLCS